jgi:hypothetical protein
MMWRGEERRPNTYGENDSREREGEGGLDLVGGGGTCVNINTIRITDCVRSRS